MPNNEIERIAEKIKRMIVECSAIRISGSCADCEQKVIAALSEMRTIALREAAEIASNKYGNEFKIAGEGIAAAILGRIDK